MDVPKWIDNLRGLNVIVTGDFRPDLGLNRSELHSLLQQHGANVHNDVKRSTDLLIRADSPMWLYGDFGQREAELAENQKFGREVGVVDVDGLGTLLDGAGVWARDPMFPPDAIQPVGRSYVVSSASSGQEMPELFERDPAALERALAGHATTQNALAAFVQSRGFEPLSPAGSAAQFDLAWNAGDAIWVAEIKSVTMQNEAIQLRLGLGQVLEYAWRLAHWHGRTVRAVLVPEAPPSDTVWAEITATCGVVLTWPEEFKSLGVALGSA